MTLKIWFNWSSCNQFISLIIVFCTWMVEETCYRESHIPAIVYSQFSSVAQSCPTLCNTMDCSPPGSSVHGNSPGVNTGVGCHTSFRGYSQPRDWTQVSHIAGRFFTIWATRPSICPLFLYEMKVLIYLILDMTSQMI